MARHDAKASAAKTLPAPREAKNGMSEDSLALSFQERRTFSIAKDEYTATPYDDFMTTALMVRDRMIERWIKTQQRYHKQNLKRVYYLSMEFLIGRLLRHGVSSLDIEEPLREALWRYNIDLEKVCEQEPDAGLGNGGLGRLAACLMDSMSTLGVPANGYGIMFDYGIFKQVLRDGHQVEQPDKWLRLGTPWAIGRPEYTLRVRFGGRTVHAPRKDGRHGVQWVDTEDVLAMPYDIPVPGFRNGVVNTLRLWSSKGTEEFDLDYFNTGDYVKAYDRKISSENLTKVLYPNDGFEAGVELRLKQEYFLSASSLADIVRRFKVHNPDFRAFPEKVVLQLNDTHPALAIPELMRILLDDEGLEWDAAWEIVTRSFAYTNHTLMPEALETWPVTLMGRLLPRHLEIIFEINARFLREVSSRWLGDMDRLRRMSLVQEGSPQRIRMAHLCLVACRSVNGVSQLHSDLLKSTLFKDFYEMFPERFNNKTNGVTPRRWLMESNRPLAGLITRSLGDRWPLELSEFKRLLPLREDAGFREDWRRAKRECKLSLAETIREMTGVLADPDSLFDVQVKRIHEYKRQLLFGLYLIHRYLRLKHEPGRDFVPRTAIFGGKAAPSYRTAKLIIKFLNSVGGVVSADKGIQDRLKIVFLADYGVSLAQKIVPACDLSEQISLAGTEASGTGNMKFMMNGALTIGTLDGANVEIAEAVGPENIFLFGLKTPEVAQRRANGYRPQELLERDPALREIFGLIESDYFSQVEPGLFKPLTDLLRYHDPYLVLADFQDYVRAQEEADERFRNTDAWTRSSITNTAKSDRFSSDRTVRDYVRDIWKVPLYHPGSSR
ncbi:MAG: glycogen/starch/alpha-glucan phosphorylase [Elusimicrobiota bacterium]|jgi:starch phosphorylase